MPGLINDEDIQTLRERADLAAVVGDYTALTRAGTRWKGLCPFHAEKTPSFTVDPAKGYFHCFGCGEGGDVYAFVQRVEALSFPEAVERLARSVGYTLRYEQLSPGQRQALGRRTRLVEALAAAAVFFEAQLAGAAGAAAREYLLSRGVQAPAATHFRLGWAPDQWDALSRDLLGRGFEGREIVDAGLATEGQRGLVDRFRARVIFPILDPSGRDVVAFGGRVLPGPSAATAGRDFTPAKYINSPETEVYKKNRTLYALNWSRSEIQRRDTALVVEGYMDVIGLHLAGVENVVATCGTALTVEHFRQLERFARRVTLALDADAAGFNAAERARALAQDTGIRELGVLTLPAGEDPADLATRGAEAVEQALRQTQTAVEFQIGHLLRTADVSTPEGQVDAYRRTFPLLSRLPDRFLRYSYIRDLVAPAVRVSADRIEDELDGHRPAAEPAPFEASGPKPAAAVAPAAQRARPGDLVGSTRGDPQLLLERMVLQASLQHPDLVAGSFAGLTEEDFRAPLSRMLFGALQVAELGDLEAVLAALPDDDLRGRVRALALAEETVDPDAEKMAGLVARLRASALQRRRVELKQRLSRSNEQLTPDDRRRLFAEDRDLERRRRDLIEGRGA